MADRRPTLVVVGAASRDLDRRDPRGWRLGGTVTYSSLAAARLGVRVRALVGVDAEAATATELDVLRAAAVEVELFALASGPVFDNQQTPAGRRQIAHSASDSIPVEALPRAWRTPAPDAVLLGPVAGELGDDWAGAFGGATFVGLAAQGLLRTLVAGRPVERLPLRPGAVLTRANAILISAEDVVGESATLRDLLRPGQELVVTHGASGAALIRLDDTGVRGRYLPPLPRRVAVDTTGAGDTFLAAWLAARLLLPDPGWRALAVAAATASLSVERTSLEETPTLADVCAVLVRLRDRGLD